MQFRLVVLGAFLVTAGLIAYSAIPHIQRNPVVTSQNIMSEYLQIPANSSVTMSRYVAAIAGEQNKMMMNVTVTGQPGEFEKIGLQIFLQNDSFSCFSTLPQNFIVNQNVSNGTLIVPIENAGTYCFIFVNSPNEQNVSAKAASISAVLERRSEQVLVSRNGSANMAGLGIGAFGFLVFVYGVARKTVIPWE